MNSGDNLEFKPTVTLTRDIIKRNLPKFKRHDDLIIIQSSVWEEFKKSLPLPVAVNENSPFSIDEDELGSLVCQTIQKPICRRLAVEHKIKNDDYRTPNIELILGDSGVVVHKENRITYKFDITKCMFSFGNINEKMRMAELDCSKEIVVDLFSGIGYFSLPLLIHAKAKHLYACEWNPDSVEALKKNLILNKIDRTRCTILKGDNKVHRPTDVAQRVILGILPSCLDWMRTAFECVDKSTGAILHCHDLIESKPTLVASGHKTTSIFNKSTDFDGKSNDSTSQQQQIQSSTSSSTSAQTIENLTNTLNNSSSSDDKTNSGESVKTTSSSPVFLEKPTDYTASSSSPDLNMVEKTNDISSNSSLYFEADSINDSCPQVNEHELDVYESRAQTLIAKIKEDVEAHDLVISLMQIKPVKSYAPHINHVVFDIKIEPKTKPMDHQFHYNLNLEDHGYPDFDGAQSQ